MHYQFQLNSDGVWDFDEIMHELSNRLFDIAFINFYSPIQGKKSKMTRLLGLRDAPKLIEQVLQVIIFTLAFHLKLEQHCNT